MENGADFFLILIRILTALVLVGLNAFFVASEFAIVKVRRTRLEELAGQGVASARISLLCVDQMDEYLSATQLGITLVSLALGWIGEPAFAHLFEMILPEDLPIREGVRELISVGLAFFLISMLHVVLGELVPKSMAIQKAEKIVLWIGRPLSFFYKVASPLIHAFTVLANSILKLIGFHNLEEPPLSEQELKIVMKESHEEGVISDSEAQIITRAFEFADKRATDIMVPVSEVDVIALNRTIEENLAVIQKKMRTRFPVCQTNLSDVIGILHIKDVWPMFNQDFTNDSLVRHCRPAIYVDGAVKQDQLLKVFQTRRAHMAIVQEQQGKSNIGIVTLEDILEHLVGDIRDEHGH